MERSSRGRPRLLHGEEIKACEEAAITVTLPKPAAANAPECTKLRDFHTAWRRTLMSLFVRRRSSGRRSGLLSAHLGRPLDQTSFGIA
jgi:hypothetical protein